VPQEITGLMHGGSMRQQLWGARCLSQVETLPLDPQMMCRLLLKQHTFASNFLLQTILLIKSEVLFYPKSFLYDGLGVGCHVPQGFVCVVTDPEDPNLLISEFCKSDFTPWQNDVVGHSGSWALNTHTRRDAQICKTTTIACMQGP